MYSVIVQFVHGNGSLPQLDRSSDERLGPRWPSPVLPRQGRDWTSDSCVRVCDDVGPTDAIRGACGLQRTSAKEHTLPGRNRPSFLKKQKEEQRRARAARKREERQARRQARSSKETVPEALNEGSKPNGGDDTK